jgi:hypothetical protein
LIFDHIIVRADKNRRRHFLGAHQQDNGRQT